MRLKIPTLVLLLMGGCVERTLTIKTDPPESLLYLNGVEVGRTPYRRDFVFYGFYDVELRKEGYQTLKAKGQVIAPWWQWPPFDLVAELAPLRLRDRQLLTYTLAPLSVTTADPGALLRRGETFRGLLESSPNTRTKSTAPTTKPHANRPSTRRST